MQVTGMLHGAKLLQFAGFPAAEVPGPDAGDEGIERLIDRDGSVFITPAYEDGVGDKGKMGLLGRAHDLKTALRETGRRDTVAGRGGPDFIGGMGGFARHRGGTRSAPSSVRLRFDQEQGRRLHLPGRPVDAPGRPGTTGGRGRPRSTPARRAPSLASPSMR